MVNLLLGGDFIPLHLKHKDTIPNVFGSRVLDILNKKDFSIINLEAPICDANNPIVKTGLNLKIPSKNIECLISGGFDAVTLSNNHIRDQGDIGVLDTIEICKKNNIKTVGAGKNIDNARTPLIIEIKGKTIGILNYTEREFNIATENQAGANPFSEVDAYYDIISLKDKCDVIIVIYHGGLEYIPYPLPSLIKTFKFLIEIGASAVISHHTHSYSGYMFHLNKPILFGLGNFYLETFNFKIKYENLIGLLVNLQIEKDGKIKFELIPTIQNNNLEKIELLENEERNRVLSNVNEISKIINNPKKLEDYWNQYFSTEESYVKALLFSINKIHYKLNKRFPFLNNRVSNFDFKNKLNLLRCESHRNKCVKILENIYNRDFS